MTKSAWIAQSGVHAGTEKNGRLAGMPSGGGTGRRTRISGATLSFLGTKFDSITSGFLY